MEKTHETPREKYLRRQRLKVQVASGIMWTVWTMAILAVFTLVVFLYTLSWKVMLILTGIFVVWVLVLWAMETLETLEHS